MCFYHRPTYEREAGSVYAGGRTKTAFWNRSRSNLFREKALKKFQIEPNRLFGLAGVFRPQIADGINVGYR